MTYSRQNTRENICCLPKDLWLKGITAVTEDCMFTLSEILTETHSALEIMTIIMEIFWGLTWCLRNLSGGVDRNFPRKIARRQEGLF